MAKIRIRKNSPTFKLLKYLALGSGVVLISLVAPQSGARLIQEVLKSYIYKKRFERARLRRDLKRMQRQGLVVFQEKEGENVEVRLGRVGRNRAVEFKLDEIRLEKPLVWDEKWRLVMFDIPNTKKLARDALRKRLRDWEMYPLQKSVFITPYPCEKEIDLIGSIFEVRSHIVALTLPRFRGDAVIQNFFGL